MGDRVGGPSAYRPPAAKAWLDWVEVYCGPAVVGAVSEGACVGAVPSVDRHTRERDLSLYSMAEYKSKVALESQSPGWKVEGGDRQKYLVPR